MLFGKKCKEKRINVPSSCLACFWWILLKKYFDEFRTFHGHLYSSCPQIQSPNISRVSLKCRFIPDFSLLFERSRHFPWQGIHQIYAQSYLILRTLFLHFYCISTAVEAIEFFYHDLFIEGKQITWISPIKLYFVFMLLQKFTTSF